MHFWIDKRASGLHYGRRRPGTFYVSRPSGLGRDKTLTSTSSTATQSSSGGQSSSSSRPSPSAGANTGSNQNHRRQSHSRNNNNNHHHHAQTAATETRGSNRLPNNYDLPSTNENSSSSAPAGVGRQESFLRGGVHGTGYYHHQQQSIGNGARGFEDFNQDYLIATSGHHGAQDAASNRSQSRSTTSSSSDDDVDPKWSRTKRIGLTLCFMAFILLGTVAAKLVIEGPSMIDAARGRRGHHEATPYYFLMTELVFILFAIALFFTGVACLRKRTNEYLLRQFQQHILQTTGRPASETRRTGDCEAGILPPSPTAFDDAFLDYRHNHHPHHHHHHHHSDPAAAEGYTFQANQEFNSSHSSPRMYNNSVIQGNETSPRRVHHHHHHSPYHRFIPGHNLGTFQQPAVGRQGDTTSPSNNTSNTNQLQYRLGPTSGSNRRQLCPHAHRHMCEGGGPPPYHIALHLPLPKETDYGAGEDDEIGKVLEQENDTVKLPTDQVQASDAQVPQNNAPPSSGEERNRPEEDGRAETPPPLYDDLAMDKSRDV